MIFHRLYTQVKWVKKSLNPKKKFVGGFLTGYELPAALHASENIPTVSISEMKALRLILLLKIVNLAMKKRKNFKKKVIHLLTQKILFPVFNSILTLQN